MKKQFLVVGALACALSAPLIGCDGGQAATPNTTGDDATTSQSGGFDAFAAYWGQWRGSVSTTGNTIYGNTSAKEQMLDINLEQDGTCTVEPLEAHADLPSDEGTWEGTESEITLHLSSGDIALTVVDQATLEGNAADFGIADFDTIQFDFYG
ncbi:hypothetical protein [Thermophilibacter sp.]